MDYFRKPFIYFEETEGVFAGDMKSPTLPGHLELVFSRLLKDKVYQSPIGVIVLRVRIDALQDIIRPDAEVFIDGASSQLLANAYITNKDGWQIADLPSAGHSMPRRYIDTDSVRQVLDTRIDSVGEYENYIGSKVLGATLFIKETGWVVTVERNVRVVFAPLKRLGYICGGIAGFALLLIFGLSFTISSGINRSIKELIQGIERIAQGDLNHKIELSRKDELRTLSDSFNAMTHSLKTSNDERERLFSIVEEAKVEWERTVDSIQDAILSCDTNHNIIRANRGASMLLGIELKVLTTMTYPDVTYHLSGFKHLVDAAYDSLKPLSGEVRDSERDKTFLASIYPIIDKDGTFQGSVQILHDITAIKKAERELEDRRIVAMTKLAELTEKRDPQTGHHLQRIKGYCRLLAEELRNQPKYSTIIDDYFIRSLSEASMLHDIGKVGIPDSILSKPGSLSPEEFEIIKTHNINGAEVLTGPDYFKMAREICLYHHERYDGKGYPDGLKGEDIPLSARIVSLADAYDALVSARPYRKAMTHDQARSIILHESGKQFCPDVVKAFVAREDEFQVLAQTDPQGT
ncbi:MAG: HD domain-containing phosphohydrolase [Candidatus Brocadiales bacterium]